MKILSAIACRLMLLGSLGCSTPANLVPVNLSVSPGKEQARIVLFRKSKFAGSGTFPEIRLDGISQGNLYNGTYMILEVSHGLHSLVADGNVLTFPFPKAEASMMFEGGNSYYLLFETELLELNTVMSRWKNGFYLMQPEYGIDSINGLKRRR